MSELINNVQKRKDQLKSLILKLHHGHTPEDVRPQLVQMLGRVPYAEVVDVEQELISEGLPVEEIQKLCDLHSAALHGAIDHTGEQGVPPGHPVHTFKMENRALTGELALIEKLFDQIMAQPDNAMATEPINQLRFRFANLFDVDKHYRRKEYLLFPFLEQKGISGPSTVMWGKHDETRAKLKIALEQLNNAVSAPAVEAKKIIRTVLQEATSSVAEMIFKEEEILFPMSLDKLSPDEWHRVYQQSLEIGFCLYDPTDEWHSGSVPGEFVVEEATENRIQLPSGSLTPSELTTILNSLPFDLTFVDKNDEVRYFTQGQERIFDRNRAIIGRKVQMCHPPSSVHIVEKILDDFKSGRENRAPFWINMRGRFIHIEYLALRDKDGAYLGTLEVSQDLTEKRALEGEQRLLSYAGER